MTWGLEGVTVGFGSTIALDDVTLEAPAGSVNVVIGGDGSGKSTMLRALVGLVPVRSGRVRRPPKREMAYVPATAGLYVDLTVEENLAFVAAAYGVSRWDLHSRSAELLERTGLSGAAHRLGGQLSGGMQRKLAVVMGLLCAPSLLVLNEPTTGIDPVSRADLWRLITASTATGTAVVVATSYVAEATRGSCVVLLEESRVLLSGAPSDLVASFPGVVGIIDSSTRPSETAWRWGRRWRVWTASGELPEGATRVEPDLADAAMVAVLATSTATGAP